MVEPGRFSHTPTLSGAMGVRCGRYELVAKIGHGGMADVFLGVAGGTGGFRKLTVVKRMHPELLEEGTFREMFLDEARLAARLNHANIVQTQEVDTAADGVPYIAMEYLEGQSMDKVIREALRKSTPLTLEYLYPWFLGILDGLSYAHTLTDYDGAELGVVHRDISPSNLFISYDGTPRLLDFGIAKASTQVAETETGQIKGKFSYMAPEQARGEVVDARADVWSMGVVMWECLAGERLFKEANHLDTIRRVLAGDVPPLETKNPQLPEELVEIVDKALAVHRADRWESAEQMRNALTAWQRESGFVPATKRELEKLMKSLFADRIESQRAQIKSALEAYDAREAMSGEQPIMSIDDSSVTGAFVTHQEPKRQSKLVPILAGALILVVGVLGGLLLTRGNDSDDETATAASEASEASETTAAGANGSEETSEEEEPPASVQMAETVATDTGDAEETSDSAEASEGDAEESDETEDEATASAMRRRWRPRRQQQQARTTPMEAAVMEPTVMEAPPAPPPAVRETGRLSIVTTPWSEVYLGGRRIGQTPLIGLEVPAGRHVLVLRNPEENLETRYPVRIEADQHERVRISLR